jgi:hypothetical protein
MIRARVAKIPDGVLRAQHTPLRREPHRGQVAENTSKPSINEHWGVFHEDVLGSNLANDPCKFSPEARSGTVDAFTFASAGYILAGKPARNDVNNASPRSSVKTAHVRPNWESFENSIVLSLRQNLCSVGITLNGADGSPSKEFASENSATSAREKSQLIQNTSG